MSTRLACIGGAAAYKLLEEGAFVAERLGPQQTPFGASQPIYLCRAEQGEFHFLARHGDSRSELAPGAINYRANIYAFKELGVQSIVSWSEARAISHNYKVGQYVLVSDVIDETRGRPGTFFENRLGNVRQWPVFCPTLMTAVAKTLRKQECCHSTEGVYVCTEGPRRETPAEARKYATFGAELIGNTLAPEVFLATELEMCYACLAYIAQYAENGSDFRPFENGRVLAPETEKRRAEKAVERFPRILETLCEILPATKPGCKCETTMQEQVSAGRIEADWRTWFEADRNAAIPNEDARAGDDLLVGDGRPASDRGWR